MWKAINNYLFIVPSAPQSVLGTVEVSPNRPDPSLAGQVNNNLHGTTHDNILVLDLTGSNDLELLDPAAVILEDYQHLNVVWRQPGP